MKKKRYLPFGYQMNEGNIIPDILESSAVQSIFENYRNGASLQMLAKQMQQSAARPADRSLFESIIEIMYISSGNALPAIRKQGICPT